METVICDTKLNVTTPIPGCEVKLLVIPFYLDLVNEASDRSSSEGMSGYEEPSEHVRTSNSAEKNKVSKYERRNMKAKSTPVSMGGEYDCINEYEDIHLNEYEHIHVSYKSQTADGGQCCTDTYEPLNINNSKSAAKKKIPQQKCIVIAGTTSVLIVLVLAVVGAVAITLVRVKKNSEDNVVGKLYFIMVIIYCTRLSNINKILSNQIQIIKIQIIILYL